MLNTSTSSTNPTPQPNQHNTGGKAKPVLPDYDSLRRYDEHLRLRGKAGRTREEYLRYARKVVELARVDPATLGGMHPWIFPLSQGEASSASSCLHMPVTPCATVQNPDPHIVLLLPATFPQRMMLRIGGMFLALTLPPASLFPSSSSVRQKQHVNGAERHSRPQGARRGSAEALSNRVRSPMHRG